MSADTYYATGSTVQHAVYGTGTVVTSEPSTAGQPGTTEISFPDQPKPIKFITMYAPITLPDGTKMPDLHSFNDDVTTSEVREELRKQTVRKIVRDAIRDAEQGESEPFDYGLLGDVLERPTDPPARIQGLIPWNASTLLVAQRKTGKTTFILNWCHALLTGEDFLGRFPTEPINGRVALLNYEVSAATVARWAHENGIEDDGLLLVNLRGRRNPLSHPEDRGRLAELLRGHNVQAVAVDPFGRAFNGKSQNDAGEVTAWLVALDTFVRSDVGATDLMLATHAGWNGERSRGSTALEDWGDVIITLTSDGEDDGHRYIKAIGRDVDVDEDRLNYDPTTRRLSLSGDGSRKKSKDQRKLTELAVLVVRSARETPGLSYAAAERAIKGMDDNPGFRNGDVAKAAKIASDAGQLVIGHGPRGGASLTAVDLSHLSPTSPGDTPSTSPTSPYRGEVVVEDSSTPKLSPLGELA